MKPKTLISSICILLAICLAIYFYAEWQKQEFDATLPVPPEPPAEEQTGGHWHGDEWHADDAHGQDDWQPGDELIPSVDWQPNTRPHEAAKPGNLGELDAEDPVAKAWAKVDYIADNPFAWGGHADPRTPALIAQLTPPPVIMGSDEGAPDDISEDIVMLMEELCPLRDPRSIEILVAYKVESPFSGSPLTDALIAMGPPVVPHLIPYLDLKEEDEYYTRGVATAARILGPVGTRYREDLEGIVEHIILPKLEQLYAENPRNRRVKRAIDQLKK